MIWKAIAIAAIWVWYYATAEQEPSFKIGDILIIHAKDFLLAVGLTLAVVIV